VSLLAHALPVAFPCGSKLQCRHLRLCHMNQNTNLQVRGWHQAIPDESLRKPCPMHLCHERTFSAARQPKLPAPRLNFHLHYPTTPSLRDNICYTSTSDNNHTRMNSPALKCHFEVFNARKPGKSQTSSRPFLLCYASNHPGPRAAVFDPLRGFVSVPDRPASKADKPPAPRHPVIATEAQGIRFSPGTPRRNFVEQRRCVRKKPTNWEKQKKSDALLFLRCVFLIDIELQFSLSLPDGSLHAYYSCC
jgi:hypothetical protein